VAARETPPLGPDPGAHLDIAERVQHRLQHRIVVKPLDHQHGLVGDQGEGPAREDLVLQPLDVDLDEGRLQFEGIEGAGLALRLHDGQFRRIEAVQSVRRQIAPRGLRRKGRQPVIGEAAIARRMQGPPGRLGAQADVDQPNAGPLAEPRLQPAEHRGIGFERDHLGVGPHPLQRQDALAPVGADIQEQIVLTHRQPADQGEVPIVQKPERRPRPMVESVLDLPKPRKPVLRRPDRLAIHVAPS
jgi:hypothetical protein